MCIMRIESPRSMTGNRAVSQELKSKRKEGRQWVISPNAGDGELVISLFAGSPYSWTKKSMNREGQTEAAAQLSFNDHWLDCQCLLGTVAGALL